MLLIPFLRRWLWLVVVLPLPVLAQSVADPSRRAESVTVRPAMTTIRSDVALDAQGGAEFDSFAPSSPGDRDLGEQLILRQRERVERFLFSADSLVMWTDNAAHASAGEVSDAFWGWRVAADWQPQIAGRLSMPVGVSQSWFRYDELEALDFESMEVNAGLAWQEPALDNAMLFLQYNYERLTQHQDELMNSHSIRAGVQHLLLINRRTSLLSAVYGDWDVDNDVAALKRNEYTASVSWRLKLTRQVETVVGYRYTYFDYAEVDRQDHLHLLEFSAIYTPYRWLQVYASLSWAFNRSDLDVYDYEAGTLGGGIGLRIRF